MNYALCIKKIFRLSSLDFFLTFAKNQDLL